MSFSEIKKNQLIFVWGIFATLGSMTATFVLPLVPSTGGSGFVQSVYLWDFLCSLGFSFELTKRFRQKTREIPPSKLTLLSDLGAMLPGLLIAQATNNPWWSLLLIFRIAKILKIRKLLPRFDLFIMKYNIRSLAMLITITLAMHTIACVWLLVEPLDGALSQRYLAAVYWTITTLTTVGYGDITPTTDLSRVFTMLVMLIGVAFYGLVIGTISKIIANIQKHKAASEEKIHDLVYFMDHYQIPVRVQNEVFDFVHHLIHQSLSSNDESIINDLPKTIKDELRIYMKAKLIREIPLFDHTPEEVLKKLAANLKQEFCIPGKKIIHQGDTGKEMYIISHGSVEVLSAKGEVMAILDKGQFFGEIALVRNVTRTADIVAKTYCDLYVLTQEDFLKTTDSYPKILEKVVSTIRERTRSKNQS